MGSDRSKGKIWGGGICHGGWAAYFSGVGDEFCDEDSTFLANFCDRQVWVSVTVLFEKYVTLTPKVFTTLIIRRRDIYLGVDKTPIEIGLDIRRACCDGLLSHVPYPASPTQQPEIGDLTACAE